LKELARERKKARSLVPPSMPPQQGNGALGKNNAFSRLYEADVYDNSKTNSYQVSPAVSDHGEGQQPAANIAVAPALNNSNVEPTLLMILIIIMLMVIIKLRTVAAAVVVVCGRQFGRWKKPSRSFARAISQIWAKTI